MLRVEESFSNNAADVRKNTRSLHIFQSSIRTSHIGLQNKTAEKHYTKITIFKVYVIRLKGTVSRDFRPVFLL